MGAIEFTPCKALQVLQGIELQTIMNNKRKYGKAD